MKRSSFLKSLLGVGVLPFGILSAKDHVVSSSVKDTLASTGIKTDPKFKTVFREAIRDCIFPKVKRWVVVDIDNICRLESVTYVDKEVNGTRFGVIVRYSHFINGAIPSEFETDYATRLVNADGIAILASDYQPNEMFDFIIIG